MNKTIAQVTVHAQILMKLQVKGIFFYTGCVTELVVVDYSYLSHIKHKIFDDLFDLSDTFELTEIGNGTLAVSSN